MRNTLLMVGIVAGCATSLPMLYQSHPDAVVAMLRAVAGSGAAARQPEANSLQPAVPDTREAPELLGKKVRLEADKQGHFVGDFRLNGAHVEAMVDTGATFVAINESTARDIGIELTPADFKYKINTANGQTMAAAARILQLQIGRIVLENVQAIVLDDASLSRSLIGMSFLKRLAKYQVEDNSLVLEE